MTLIGNIWGILATLGLIYAGIMPWLNKRDNLERFNKQ